VAGNPGTLGMTKERAVLHCGSYAGLREQQVPPLRFAPVGMTIHISLGDAGAQ
jgi:hypothetical protein